MASGPQTSGLRQSGLAQRTPPPLADLIDEGPAALFLDFDGTLVEIAPAPDRIAPRAGLADALAALGARLGGRLAVISGRAIDDIESHVGPLGIAAAGSHGSDIRTASGTALGEEPAGLPDAIAAALRDFARREGLSFEEKPHGGALHYRAAPERAGDVQAFARDLARDHGWQVQGGKDVVELVARGANKGGAVDIFMQEPPFAGSRPFFIGDDLTDEAGFAACERHGGAGIIVGDRAETAANYRLAGVSEVFDWLGLSA